MNQTDRIRANDEVIRRWARNEITDEEANLILREMHDQWVWEADDVPNGAMRWYPDDPEM